MSDVDPDPVYDPEHTFDFHEACNFLGIRKHAEAIFNCHPTGELYHLVSYEALAGAIYAEHRPDNPQRTRDCIEAFQLCMREYLDIANQDLTRPAIAYLYACDVFVKLLTGIGEQFEQELARG